MAAPKANVPALVHHVAVFCAQKLNNDSRQVLIELLGEQQSHNPLGRVPDNAGTELTAAKAAIASA